MKKKYLFSTVFIILIIIYIIWPTGYESYKSNLNPQYGNGTILLTNNSKMIQVYSSTDYTEINFSMDFGRTWEGSKIILKNKSCYNISLISENVLVFKCISIPENYPKEGEKTYSIMTYDISKYSSNQIEIPNYGYYYIDNDKICVVHDSLYVYDYNLNLIGKELKNKFTYMKNMVKIGGKLFQLKGENNCILYNATDNIELKLDVSYPKMIRFDENSIVIAGLKDGENVKIEKYNIHKNEFEILYELKGYKIINDLNTHDGFIIYAFCNKDFYSSGELIYSKDKGATWKKLDLHMEHCGGYVYNKGYLYILSQNLFSRHNMYKIPMKTD